ncbi:hypothetical protein LJR029_002907 [Caballeronia sp. LjRoot29]|uniref:hypothetical protein n=1 Tax=Caballeronia sp. LjRoot29 TaxID=3342315 RepID=UPI003ECE5757
MTILFFLLQIVYSLLQSAALFAGLEYWLGWPNWVCALIGAIFVFGLRITPITVPLGILGAHYGFQWSWPMSLLLFFGPLLLLIALAIFGRAAGGIKWLVRW